LTLVTGAVGAILIYFCVFVMFLFFARFISITRGHANAGDRDNPGVRYNPWRSLCRHYDIKPPRVFDTVSLVVLALVFIVTFLLLNGGAVAVFELLGYSPPSVDVTIPTFWHYVLVVFAMAVLPAIVEELVFRGVILHNLLRYGRVWAVIMSALLFSLFHMSPAQTVAQFALGILLAYLYLARGNMVYPMILHFINNFAILTYTYIMQADPPAVWNATTIVTMCVLFVIGCVVIVGAALAMSTRPAPKLYAETHPRTHHVVGSRVFDISMYVLGVVMAGAVWLFAFFG